MNVIHKLSTPVRDKATGMEGQLTHFQLEGGNGVYIFQPKGLSTDSGEPFDSFWVTSERIEGGTLVLEPYLGREFLGTIVTDKNTGFTGMAVASILHPNGCLHLDVQPSGVGKNGDRIKRHNFDIRDLKDEEGNDLRPMKEVEREASKVDVPSPSSFPRLRS